MAQKPITLTRALEGYFIHAQARRLSPSTLANYEWAYRPLNDYREYGCWTSAEEYGTICLDRLKRPLYFPASACHPNWLTAQIAAHIAAGQYRLLVDLAGLTEPHQGLTGGM